MRVQSLNDYKRRVDLLPSVGGEWRSAFVLRGPKCPPWAPPEILYFCKDSLEVLRSKVVGDIRAKEHMKWAPEKLFNRNGKCTYSELSASDWWWNRISFTSQTRTQSHSHSSKF